MSCVSAVWLRVGETMGQDERIRDVAAQQAALSSKRQMASSRSPINTDFMDGRSLTATTFLAALRPNIGSVGFFRGGHAGPCLTLRFPP